MFDNSELYNIVDVNASVLNEITPWYATFDPQLSLEFVIPMRPGFNQQPDYFEQNSLESTKHLQTNIALQSYLSEKQKIPQIGLQVLKGKGAISRILRFLRLMQREKDGLVNNAQLGFKPGKETKIRFMQMDMKLLGSEKHEIVDTTGIQIGNKIKYFVDNTSVFDKDAIHELLPDMLTHYTVICPLSKKEEVDFKHDVCSILGHDILRNAWVHFFINTNLYVFAKFSPEDEKHFTAILLKNILTMGTLIFHTKLWKHMGLIHLCLALKEAISHVYLDPKIITFIQDIEKQLESDAFDISKIENSMRSKLNNILVPDNKEHHFAHMMIQIVIDHIDTLMQLTL